jgi:hypothetical protein
MVEIKYKDQYEMANLAGQTVVKRASCSKTSSAYRSKPPHG